MNRVKINFENYYGVKNSVEDLDFTQHKSILV